jgi:hypothetical protein
VSVGRARLLPRRQEPRSNNRSWFPHVNGGPHIAGTEPPRAGSGHRRRIEDEHRRGNASRSNAREEASISGCGATAWRSGPTGVGPGNPRPMMSNNSHRPYWVTACPARRRGTPTCCRTRYEKDVRAMTPARLQTGPDDMRTGQRRHDRQPTTATCATNAVAGTAAAATLSRAGASSRSAARPGASGPDPSPGRSRPIPGYENRCRH